MICRTLRLLFGRQYVCKSANPLPCHLVPCLTLLCLGLQLAVHCVLEPSVRVSSSAHRKRLNSPHFLSVQYDTVIPLARPIDGSSSLAVPAGTNIRIGLPTTNSIPELWGSDCDDFRPERWLEFKNGYDPKGVTGGLERGQMIPGVWSNM